MALSAEYTQVDSHDGKPVRASFRRMTLKKTVAHLAQKPLPRGCIGRLTHFFAEELRIVSAGFFQPLSREAGPVAAPAAGWARAAGEARVVPFPGEGLVA
jgi:hypothetical protein